MFTGIIQELGTVERLQRAHGLARLTIRAPKTTAKVERLESIAVNGVCLTAVQASNGLLVFELIPETQRLTTLGRLRQGDRVHLEPSLTLSDRLNGHVLLGHVDGLGTVATRRQVSGELALGIRVVDGRLPSVLVPKGPVAVDGVSLTVGQRLGRSVFTVHLIPETLRQTTLGDLKVGDRVNLELDYLAKLVRQWLKSGRS